MAMRFLPRGLGRAPLTPRPSVPARPFSTPSRTRTGSGPLVPPSYGKPAATGHAGSSSSGGGKKNKSGYGVLYGEIFPGAMIPIFVLSTGIFLALSLIRTHLSHNRSLAESGERIAALETQLARLRAEAKRRQERERRERERILPLVVERVLQRVGAMEPEEEVEVEEDRLLV